MLDETVALIPLLQSPNSHELLKNEITQNQLMALGKTATRTRNLTEIRRRFNSVPLTYWDWFMQLSREDKVGALFFVILKAYYLLFDFQLNVVMSQWRSARQTITKADVMMHLNEIAANDDFVDGWSAETKARVCTGCIAFLRGVGMLDPKTDVLKPLRMSDEAFAYYLETGEAWFLEACLLQPYEISRIKEGLK